MSSRRIGVFGGTFDPIHRAHVAMGRAAWEQAGLDEVLFLVAGEPPHKGNGVNSAPEASSEDRYTMVCRALEGENGLTPSRLELERNGISYTVETLRQLEACYPETTFYLMVGFDSLVDLPNWREPEEIVRRARLLTVPRVADDAEIPGLVRGHYELLAFEATDLSSTEVRRCIRAGDPFDDLVPPPVAAYIREKGLYGYHEASATCG